MINLLIDFISRVYANVFMILMGDAHMEASTVLTGICGGATLIGIAALVWFSRPHPSAPSQTIIIQPPTTQSEESITPALMMVFVVFLMFGGGLFIYLAR